MAMWKFFGVMESEILITVPLFVSMGTIPEKSGVTQCVYQSLYEPLGPVSSGLAFATLAACTIFALCMGVIAATMSTMTLLQFPPCSSERTITDWPRRCLRRGSFGILISQSVMLVMYGPMANLFVAKLFTGLLLSFLHLIYEGSRCWLQPTVAPAISLKIARALICYDWELSI
jgi:TRAP-type mannitol/chloroaromatic compound transport system permease large subunit